MTIYSPSATVVAHTDDATFRAWIQEYHTAILATGMVVAADTGQLDLATAIRPAANTAAGFRIYKTNDGLVDLYLKVEFGTGNALTTLGVWLTAGLGTNGSGTINASGSTTRSLASVTGAPNASPYPTRACGITGCWWLAFKIAGTGNGTLSGFALMRFCNAAGAPTSDGFVFYFPATVQNLQGQQVRIASLLVSGISANFCFMPADVTSPVVGTDIQFWKHYTAQPRMRCNPFALTCDVTVATEGTQRSVTPVGSTPHNYISNGPSFMKSAGVGAANTGSVALMVWE